MPNSSCRLLSNGYKFNIDSDSNISFRPCCVFGEKQKLDAPLEELLNYRKMLNNIDSYKDDRCSVCNFQNDRKLRNTWRDMSFNLVSDDAELGDANYLELQIDNTCNGGCIICGPYNSSYWSNELKQFPIKSAEDPIDKILSFVDIQKTRGILFLGGEPFLSDVDERLLSLIKNPELVSVQYTTNGSIYPSQKRIDLWSRLRNVRINFSLDGVGSKFNYIRYPLIWDRVEENIIRMQQELPRNVVFKSNHVVNILNLYYHDEFEKWYNSLSVSPRFGEFTFTPCEEILSPKRIPTKLFNLIAQKYSPDSKVMKVIVDRDTNDQTRLLNYLSQLDNRRGLDWRKVFPEISNCF